jgi:hypothetical protein
MSRAIVFDFDGTLTVKRAKPKYNLIELFGGYERILKLVSFIRRLYLKNIHLYICSGSKEELIQNIIQDLTNTGFYIELAWFKEISGENAEKHLFLNDLTEDKIVFIDDNVLEEETINPNVTIIQIDEPLVVEEIELQVLAILNTAREMETPTKRPKSVFKTPESPGQNLDCFLCGKMAKYKTEEEIYFCFEKVLWKKLLKTTNLKKANTIQNLFGVFTKPKEM